MVSREGEVVAMHEPVDVDKNPKVDLWLTQTETAMRVTLAMLLEKAVGEMTNMGDALGTFFDVIDPFPTQVIILASELAWSQALEKALQTGDTQSLQAPLTKLEAILKMLAERVLTDLTTDRRKKCEQLIHAIVHERDVTRLLLQADVHDVTDFKWLYHMRYYWMAEEKNVLQKLHIKMSSANFYYGFEYLGVGERLVTTPLTDRCYLTLTQALHLRMGGNPFGPAGTGKTESVKALGAQLGRFVLVFNCDENFDFQAMGRLFVGLCQVGAWGCFDEFNRLEERILSAVSQQILIIQQGLTRDAAQIELLGKNVKLSGDVGIFVTMNPGYAGRSNLPDNLKQLFRPIAMVAPNAELIAQVMLFSQGITTAEALAGKITLLFRLCKDQLSSQPHYDFGLRALKSVLKSAGNLKRKRLEEQAKKAEEDGGAADLPDLADVERGVLLRSFCDTVVPKLVAEDLPVFSTLLSGVFPGVELNAVQEEQLRLHIATVAKKHMLLEHDKWVDKALQLYQVQILCHGVMMVGPSGTGKTSVWKVLLEAMELLDGTKGNAYVIDPKAVTKDELYGTLDPTTLEWTDGVFTDILRGILNNVRGESGKRHWIIFDGDVDPEWAENLNSVLDDNKLLTLPSGERLEIPPNVRIMMETETLQYATLATVSRCGMVWFSEDTLEDVIVFGYHLNVLANSNVEGQMGGDGGGGGEEGEEGEEASLPSKVVEVLRPHFEEGGMVEQLLQFSLEGPHVMVPTRSRLLLSLFSLLLRAVYNVVEYNEGHPDFPMSDEHMERYVGKWLLFSLLWGFGGSMDYNNRIKLCEQIKSQSTIEVPDSGGEMIDFEVVIDSGEWRAWEQSIPKLELEAHKCLATDVVVTTVDTVRHVEVLRAWLADHRPLILCGPPGSGKTMSLNSVLQSMPELELATLNFSSGTTPELILKTFQQYCEYKKGPDGLVLAPVQHGKWLVVFCDEVNLPANDSYGTQRVIMFLRQLAEQGGFWRADDNAWVTIERIQFVGACNPPTDPGRVPLSLRFLRHTPLLLVDYPGPPSLRQIYGTFTRALLKLQPQLRANHEPLTNAMVDFYLANKARFNTEMQPHYIYSPRELSRWTRALYEAMEPIDNMSLDMMVRLWAHEGLRLFHDRLVTDEERQWCEEKLEEIANINFAGADVAEAMKKPILFSNWMTKTYTSVGQEELRQHVEARLKVFYEEELNVELVVFDSVLEHVLRIDRVLRQPLGHLLLVGESGAGKTVLTRFVSWMNGLSVFQVKMTRRYTIEDFEEDLRGVLKRSGCGGEKICFIFDESNVLDSAFLEAMNALLASGEVPGLFEGDDHVQLMSACRDAAQRDGVILDSEEELFRRFTTEVQRNLHVVFTMNPAGADLGHRSATSPALFNRCVVDWFGTWSQMALVQVAQSFTAKIDVEDSHYEPGVCGDPLLEMAVMVSSGSDTNAPTFYDAIVASIVHMHNNVDEMCTSMASLGAGPQNFISPRDYLDFITHYSAIHSQKKQQLEEQQLHLNIGLDKLKQTEEQVAVLQLSLNEKEKELTQKNKEANDMLQQMVTDQNEAEKNKAEALILSEELAKQDAIISERRVVVEEDLGRAEPALIDAQSAVKGIKKAHLDEVRGLARPPPMVQMSMEAVCIMIEEKFDDWSSIRKIIRKDDFIQKVIDFDTDSMSKKARMKIEKNYLSNEDFTFEKVNRASRACGPLAKWIRSQIEYASILVRVQPLRDEVQKLTDDSQALRTQSEDLTAKISELESSIAVFKDEYAMLINATQAIKGEMEQVKGKCERSTALLGSLGKESVRWQAGCEGFQAQMQTLAGDTLLAGAFITYCGFFDYKQRRELLRGWRVHQESVGVPSKEVRESTMHALHNACRAQCTTQQPGRIPQPAMNYLHTQGRAAPPLTAPLLPPLLLSPPPLPPLPSLAGSGDDGVLVQGQRAATVACQRTSIGRSVCGECHHHATLQPVPPGHRPRRTGLDLPHEPIQGPQDQQHLLPRRFFHEGTRVRSPLRHAAAGAGRGEYRPDPQPGAE
jgi:dynein heavy chain 1